LEARVGIGPFSPQLRDKNAHFAEEINLNLLNQTIPILTVLVSVLVSAHHTEPLDGVREPQLAQKAPRDKMPPGYPELHPTT
jgi:hypothetical protein